MNFGKNVCIVVVILAGIHCEVFDLPLDVFDVIQSIINGSMKSSYGVDPSLQSTLNALANLFDYFKRHILELNVDAVFVTGLARDQLRVILNKLTKYPRSSFASVSYQDAKSQLENLIKTADSITSQGTIFVSIIQYSYYNLVKQLCNYGFWNMDYPSKVTNSTLLNHQSQLKDLQGFASNAGKVSDNCLSEATKTGESEMCKISEDCWSAMTGSGTSGYILIHQVMYLEVLERMGCGQSVQLYATKLNQGSVNQLLDVFCAHALADVKIVEAIEPTQTYKQDIFMEEALLCGLAGYRDFFRKEWLSKILAWQKSEGCYGIFSDEEKYLFGPVGIQVKKRQEKRLSDDCLAHKSAVAAGVLSQYVRYLLEDSNLIF